MEIGGFMSCSLSDYPGHVSAVVFTQGCNFRCPFCHNGNLIPASKLGSISEEILFSNLERLRGKVDSVVVTGGEPTIQRSLPDFLRQIRELGFATKLDTNGSRPDMLEIVLEERLVDFVAMDVKAPAAIYSELCGVKVDYSVLRRSMEMIAARKELAFEFRTTFVRPLLSGSDIDTIKNELPNGAGLKVQRFLPENALDPNLDRTAAFIRAEYCAGFE